MGQQDTEAKIRALASLQLFAMEHDGEARRIMEKAVLEAAVRQSRELAIWQVATLTIFLLVVASLLSGASFIFGLIIYVALVARCVSSMVIEQKGFGIVAKGIEEARAASQRAAAQVLTYTK